MTKAAVDELVAATNVRAHLQDHCIASLLADYEPDMSIG